MWTTRAPRCQQVRWFTSETSWYIFKYHPLLRRMLPNHTNSDSYTSAMYKVLTTFWSSLRRTSQHLPTRQRCQTWSSLRWQASSHVRCAVQIHTPDSNEKWHYIPGWSKQTFKPDRFLMRAPHSVATGEWRTWKLRRTFLCCIYFAKEGTNLSSFAQKKCYEMKWFSSLHKPSSVLSRNWCQATWHNWRAHAEHWKLLESNVWAADFQVKLMILFQSVFQKQWATISGKPLYFLRNNISLETNEVLRLVWCESTPKERVERILKNTL